MEKSSVTYFPRKPELLLSVLVVGSAIFCGCSSSPKPSTATDPVATRPASVLPDTLPDLPPPPPIREVSPSSPRAVKVISEGNEGKTQPSLIEASRMAKAKKKNDGEVRPVIEINDENLKEYSNLGQVFVVESGGSETLPPAAPEGDPAVPGATEPAPVAVEGAIEGGPSANADRELFWRQSVSELRSSLRRSIEDLRRIELESTLLRQQFYSESDPFVRDSEVKPRWDRALDQLVALRKKAKDDHSALTSLLAEAKKSGISPEWLQDGGNVELTEEELRLINGPAATQR